MARNKHDYSVSQYRATLCTNTDVKIGFSADCDTVMARMGTPLWQESFWATWEASSLCGGSTCIAFIFGKEETITSILLRATVVAAVVSAIIYVTWRVVTFVDNLLDIKKKSKDFSYPSSKRGSDNRRERLQLTSGPTIEMAYDADDDIESTRIANKKEK
jgi:hypothetical protein